jgi:hypothetical protein
MVQENVVYMYNGGLLSHKEKRHHAVEGEWMQLEDIMLSGVSQIQKDKGRIFSLIYGR